MKTAHQLAGCALLIICLPAAAKNFDQGVVDHAPPLVLNNSQGQNNHWSGIGLFTAKHTCNASLIDTRAYERDGPGYVLTSGHCFEFPHQQLINTDTEVNVAIRFNNFQDTPQNQAVYTIKRVNWQSLQGTNLAIAELDAPLSRLIANGIHPLTVGPAPQTSISGLLVGASSPRVNALAIRSCLLQPSADTVAHPAVWRNALKSQCNLTTSTLSGSPMLDRDSNTIIAVLGAIPLRQNARNRCDQSAPCETSDGIAQAQQLNTQYSHTVENLSNCWKNGVLNNDPDYCSLYPATITTLSAPKPVQHYLPALSGDEHPAIFPTWDVKFSISTPFYRYKVVDRSESCQNPADYSTALTSRNAHVTAPVGAKAGISMLCLLGVSSENQGPLWGDLSNVRMLAVNLVEQGDAWMPAISATGFGFERPHWTELTLVRDAHFNTRYFVKSGPPASTECEAHEGYSPIADEAFEKDTFKIVRQAQTTRHCLYSHNIRNDQSAVVSYQMNMQP